MIECYAEKLPKIDDYPNKTLYGLTYHTYYDTEEILYMDSQQLKAEMGLKTIYCYNLKINEKTGRLVHQNAHKTDMGILLKDMALKEVTKLLKGVKSKNPDFYFSIHDPDDSDDAPDDPKNLCQLYIHLIDNNGVNFLVLTYTSHPYRQWSLISSYKNNRVAYNVKDFGVIKDSLSQFITNTMGITNI